MNKHKVFVFGYYGFKNTGDDAMEQALVNEIAGRCMGIIRYHEGDTLLSVLKHVIEADVVLVGGGTHLRNWGTKGIWHSARIILFGLVCRLLGKKFNMVNIGVDGKMLEWLAKKVANTVTIRDRQTADSALLLNFTPRPKEKLLGINLRPVNSTYYNNEQRDAELMVEVCKAVRKWQSINPNWRVQFFSFNAGKDTDEEICCHASQLIPNSTLYHWQPGVYDTLSEISKCNLFIGMRYHSLVFAYMTGTPFIAIESYPRCHKFSKFIHNPIRSISMEDILNGKLYSLLSKAMEMRNKAVASWLSLDEARKLARKGIVI